MKLTIGEHEECPPLWFHILPISEVHCLHMQSWKHCYHDEDAICKDEQEILQGPMDKNCWSVGSVNRPSEEVDTIKNWVRQVGLSTIQPLNVTFYTMLYAKIY